VLNKFEMSLKDSRGLYIYNLTSAIHFVSNQQSQLCAFLVEVRVISHGAFLCVLTRDSVTRAVLHVRNVTMFRTATQCHTVAHVGNLTYEKIKRN